jgi:hypothetical protein
MASVVDICNIALSNLGDQKISSLSDANERARVCNLRYDDVRDSVLRSHPWSCAIKRTQLARNDTAPVWGFDYAYSLPSDCLRVLDVEEWETPFRIENGNIVTDAEKVKLKYIKQVLDPNEFDSLIIQAIALKLASEIAESLTGRPELRNNMLSKFLSVVAEARSIDSAERANVDTLWSDVFIEARR